MPAVSPPDSVAACGASSSSSGLCGPSSLPRHNMDPNHPRSGEAVAAGAVGLSNRQGRSRAWAARRPFISDKRSSSNGQAHWAVYACATPPGARSVDVKRVQRVSVCVVIVIGRPTVNGLNEPTESWVIQPNPHAQEVRRCFGGGELLGAEPAEAVRRRDPDAEFVGFVREDLRRERVTDRIARQLGQGACQECQPRQAPRRPAMFSEKPCRPAVIERRSDLEFALRCCDDNDRTVIRTDLCQKRVIP